MSHTPTPAMSIEDARRVLWLRNNHRPLGELLDEGYLTRGRLEWAAAKAYDPALKQAAQALIGENKAQFARTQAGPLPVGISLEDARATNWPLHPYKGRKMGELVESMELSLKDLGYAIENAWERRVRQAAIALTLVRLDQIVKEPPTPAGPLQVASGGRSFAERRQLFLAMIEGVLLGAALAVPSTLLISGITRQPSAPQGKPPSYFLATPSRIIAIITVLAVIAGAIWLFFF
jgi:hypothetical protein